MVLAATNPSETDIDVDEIDDIDEDVEPDVPDVDDVDDTDPPDDEAGDGDDDHSGPWVTVATFWEAPRMHLARIKLESEGIPCVVADENLVAVDWLMANAVGGIKLQVPQSHAARAVTLLGISPAPHEPSSGGSSDPGACPRCGSPRIERPRLDRRLSLVSLFLLNFPIPIFTRKVRCENCGHLRAARRG